jgi:nucleoside-diphosphate-sugar epimerase
MATARRPEQLAAIRTAGGLALACDLDQRRGMQRLAALSRWVVHLAPPPNQGPGDPRTKALIAQCSAAALRTRAQGRPARWAYVSTSGVYGDRAGAWVDESSSTDPSSERGARRLAAERLLRGFGVRTGARVALLRAPGIYAMERLPIDRLRQQLPALLASEDVYTNHIHADDLAHACWLALWRGASGRAYNISDDSQMKMGDYFDAVARAFSLPCPPRLPMTELKERVSPMMLSFMRDSRRLRNDRMKRELRQSLQFPTVETLLASV